MFKLHFSPCFSSQKKALLAEKSIPEVHLHECLEQALQGLANDDESNVRRLKSPKELWWVCLNAGKPVFIKASLYSIFSAICAAGSTLVAVKILNQSGTLEALIVFSFFYFLLNSIAHVSSIVTNQLRYTLALTAETTLVNLISRKLLKLSPESMARQSSGNLKVLITSDVRAVGEFLNNLVRNLVPALAALIVMTPLLIHFAGKPGIVGILTLSLIVPIAIGLNQISIHYQSLTQDRMDELASLVGEWVKNIRLIRFLSWDESFENRIQAVVARFMKVAVLQHLMACIIFGLGITWWMVASEAVLVFAKLTHAPLNLTGFFGSLWLLTFISGYFTHLPNTVRLYGVAVPSIRRIFELLNEKEQSEFLLADSSPLPESPPTHLIFENVSFRYQSNDEKALPEILQNLNLKLDLQKKLAVIGEVGSGKSSFLKLLSGELPPTEGTLSVQFADGSKRNLWEQSTYAKIRSLMALVPQIPYVSSDLFSRNVSLGEDHSEQDILQSIHLAELSADLDQFTLGLHQSIGESGVNLSGGQKQRLNLARAFHSKRPYLLLDDTLSAVDQKTETALMEKLTLRSDGFILVTHRLSEIMRMNEVIVISKGQIIETGSPAELADDANSALTRALRAYDHV